MDVGCFSSLELQPGWAHWAPPLRTDLERASKSRVASLQSDAQYKDDQGFFFSCEPRFNQGGDQRCFTNRPSGFPCIPLVDLDGNIHLTTSCMHNLDYWFPDCSVAASVLPFAVTSVPFEVPCLPILSGSWLSCLGVESASCGWLQPQYCEGCSTLWERCFPFARFPAALVYLLVHVV